MLHFVGCFVLFSRQAVQKLVSQEPGVAGMMIMMIMK